MSAFYRRYFITFLLSFSLISGGHCLTLSSSLVDSKIQRNTENSSLVSSHLNKTLLAINQHTPSASLPDEQQLPIPRIDTFYLFNAPVTLTEQSRFTNKIAINQAYNLTLRHNDRSFAFKFSVVPPVNINNIEYRLLGLYDHWVTESNSEIARFDNISPGRYQLQMRVKVKQRYSTIKKLNIIITESPWQTIWAKTVYVVLLLAVVWFLVNLQRKKYLNTVLMMNKVTNSEQRLQLALWGSGDEFWDWDIEAKTSTRQNEFLKYPKPEINLKHTMAASIHPDDLDRVNTSFEQCIHFTQQQFEITYRALMPDNTWIWVLNRGKVFSRDEQNRPNRITGTIKNIQSIKETEAQLTTLNIELEDRVKLRTQELQLTRDELIDKEKMAALGGLVASITHEINTPIGICVTATSHLAQSVTLFNQKYQNDDVSHEDFEAYQEEINQCTNLVSDNLSRASTLIQSFKKVSVDQSHEDLRDFNLKQYIEEIMVSLRPLLSRTKHHFEYRCPDNIMLYSHPGAFYQIISNLINNSIIHAYNEADVGNIVLDITTHKNGLRIIFQDDGKGMSKTVKEQIFTPFFTTKRGKGGSGLGMNIVFNLVSQLLNGKVELESEPAQGTKFIIELPHEIYSVDEQ